MNPIKFFGKGVTYLGLGSLFLMSIVGSISIDIVILAAISKMASRNHRHDDGHSFVTGFLLGTMFSNNNSRHRGFYDDALAMMLISPFLTGIAVILSVALGVPEVGVLLVAGWLGAFGILAAGVAIHAMGEGLESFATWLMERGQRVTQEPTHTAWFRTTHEHPRFAQPSADSDYRQQPNPPYPSADQTAYTPGFFPGDKTDRSQQQTSAPTPSAPPAPKRNEEDLPPAYTFWPEY